MKVSERGQVTIPLAIRERHGLLPDTEVEFVEREDELVLVKNPNARREHIRQLYGQITTCKSTDEIMRLLRD